jgi:hypothetical protein
MRNKMARKGETDAEGPDGEWNFKMYTDVLHAESRGVDAEVADQLAFASKTIQQELEKKSRAAASNLKREKSQGVTMSDADEKVGLDELVGSPPEVGSPEDWSLKKKVDIMIGARPPPSTLYTQPLNPSSPHPYTTEPKVFGRKL